ncbi:hypothetical protein EDB84DRAFT_448446 [Lactarius hengduanensis]|nr:hypothetical protein EDB84DRAFT_448446 [Lactarius hengduanensis]
MEKCPTEIHAYIFELACTDGGAAGIALSAVSRHVRAVSAPYHWYTLAVAGTTQTVRLAERIRTLTSGKEPSSAGAEKGKGRGARGGPEITHLFVSNRSASRARELRYQEMGATRDMAERRRIEAAFNAEADAWARAVRVLLAYAAPTLRSLAMMCYDIHVSPNGRLFFTDLKRHRFPRLAELSIRGGFDTRLRDSYDGAPQGGEARSLRLREAAAVEEEECGGDVDEVTLPALRRLHLASPISFDLFLQRLRPLAPALTHVRLSELLAFDYDMARALHSELAERGIVPARLPRLRERQWSAEPRAVPVDWERFLPPPHALRRLVVQPAQLPPAPEELCGCCSGYYRVDDMTRLLREMAREALVPHGEGDAAVYVFLPPGPRHNAYGFEEGYRDWLGRTAGGKGCWKEQGEVDIDAKSLGVGEDNKVQSWDVVGKRAISRWF